MLSFEHLLVEIGRKLLEVFDTVLTSKISSAKVLKIPRAFKICRECSYDYEAVKTKYCSSYIFLSGGWFRSRPRGLLILCSNLTNAMKFKLLF